MPSQFQTPSTTRLPSSPIATIDPSCLLGLTFPDFDLVENETRSFAKADLIWYSAGE